MDNAQTQGSGQGNPLGAPVEHRLGADVDGDPGDVFAAKFPPDPVGGFEDDNLVSGVGQVPRRGQSSDSGSNHDDPLRLHGTSLPWNRWRRRRVVPT